VGEVQVREDLPDDVGIVQHGDQAQPAPTMDTRQNINAVLPLRLVAFGGRKTQTQVGLFFSVAAVVSMFLRPLVGGSGMILPARRSQARVGSSRSKEIQRDGTCSSAGVAGDPIHGGRNRNRGRTAPLRA
jgi:hypothetical protein